MQVRKKNNIVYVQKDNKPSRFLLDLNKKKESEELKKEPVKKIKLKKVKKKIISETVIKDHGKKGHYPTVNRLAFYPFAKASLNLIGGAIKIIYKASYFLGWLLIYIFKILISISKKFSEFQERRKDKIIHSSLQNDSDLMKIFNNKIPKPKKKGQLNNLFFKRNKEKSIVSPVEIKKESEKQKENQTKKQVKISIPISERLKSLLPRPSFAYLKNSIYFAVLLGVIALPFQIIILYKGFTDLKGKVLGTVEAGFEDLSSGAEQVGKLDFSQAKNNFEQASLNFYQAEDQVKIISKLFSIIAPIIPNEKLKMASQADILLRSGALISELGKETSASLDVFSDTDKPSIKTIVESFSAHSERLMSLSIELDSLVKRTDINLLPQEYRDTFSELSKASSILAGNVKEFSDLVEASKIFFGFDYNRRYLLVFQNNSEMRASGGFIGSFAQIDFADGELKDIYSPGGGSYDTEGGLKEKIIAPEPLSLVNPLWHFWDANWWPDWLTTAKKLMWFYEKSDRPTVDGVIGITPTAFEKILEVIGPIDMTADYGVVIDSSNFWTVVQTFSEQKADQTDKPKKIIGDLLNKIINETPKNLDKEKFLALAKAIDSGIKEKHILFYSTNADLQSFSEGLHIDGKTEETGYDYLMVVNSNIGGAKTDQKIKEQIYLSTEITEDGSVYNNLKIVRTHTGLKNEPFFGVRNVDWMRIYVPKGSELVFARGFVKPEDKYLDQPEEGWNSDPEVMATEGRAETDIDSGTKIYFENGKTVFANWSMIDPGESADISIKYKLPFSLTKKAENSKIDQVLGIIAPYSVEMTPFSLLVQKQPGSVGSDFSYQLKAKNGMICEKNYPADMQRDNNILTSKTILNTDKFFAFIFTDNYGE